MPIVNYELRAKQAEDFFFKNKKISQKNKKKIRRFLNQYKVGPARKNIFFKHIVFLLEKSNDIKRDMYKRDKINTIFKDIYDKKGKGYYSTIVNVSLRFVRWLNEGERPKGFTDIKNVSKKQQRRKLTPKDMVTWKDGLMLSKQTNSIQIKAALLTQLDGGFRPSEFIDLKYGDVEIKKEFMQVDLSETKTGEQRFVLLWRCNPYLMRWLDEHPTKKKTDPLWIEEFSLKSNKKKKGISKYNYFALAKRIRGLGAKINFEKPLDFYNLRHSSCYLDKINNIPIEEAAKRHGHSTDYFTNVYGRLSSDDSIKRLSLSMGLTEEKKKRELNQICFRCEFVNEPNKKICYRCRAPLNIKEAMQEDKSKELKIDKLEKQMAQLLANQTKTEDLIKAIALKKAEGK